MPDDIRRGRGAHGPREIPRIGWRDILLRVKENIFVDHVGILAAGVAYFALFALFPAIAALISIAGMLSSVSAIESQIASLSGILPPEAATILADQAHKLAADTDGSGAGLAAVGGVLLSLFTASRGVKALIEGMNIAYAETERRGLIRLNLTALALALFLVTNFLFALAATVATPALLGNLGFSEPAKAWVTYGRWPLLAALAMFGLAVLNRYAPSRAHPRWRWVSVGSILATLLWITASIGFSLYVGNFGRYDATYGALGGVIVLLTWLWLSAYVVLLGAELNAEMEHQTEHDSTTGKPLPKGKRGAVMADTVGRTP